jgi:hypothetical protein
MHGLCTQKKLVVLQGIDDFIIVDTKDVLLICKKDKEQHPLKNMWRK